MKDLKGNTFKSDKEYIDVTKVEGYALRKRSFRDWQARKGYSSESIAKSIGMTAEELEWRLERKELFNRVEIRGIVYLMGASEAFFTIYFPTFELRKQVYLELFGQEMKVKKEIASTE